MQLRTLAPVGHVGEQDQRPHHEQDRRQRGDQGERGDQLGDQVDQCRAQQQAEAGKQQPQRRHRRTRQPPEETRRVLLGGQAVQHATGGEDAAVGRRTGRGQHHEIHQAGGGRDAGEHEQFHERAGSTRRHGVTIMIATNGKHVEDDDADRDRVDCLGQVAHRVGRFGRGGADQFDADEGEHRDLEAGEEPAHPLREEATVIPQVGDRLEAASEAPGDQGEAGDDQRADRDDLDQREPELHLAEQLHRDQIQTQQQQHAQHRRYPRRQPREPELRVRRDGNDVGDRGDDPAEPVGPAAEEAGPWPQQIGGEVDERLTQVGQQQLAHRPHHEEQHHADDRIDQQDRRPSQAIVLPEPMNRPVPIAPPMAISCRCRLERLRRRWSGWSGNAVMRRAFGLGKATTYRKPGPACRIRHTLRCGYLQMDVRTALNRAPSVPVAGGGFGPADCGSARTPPPATTGATGPMATLRASYARVTCGSKPVASDSRTPAMKPCAEVGTKGTQGCVAAIGAQHEGQLVAPAVEAGDAVEHHFERCRPHPRRRPRRGIHHVLAQASPITQMEQGDMEAPGRQRLAAQAVTGALRGRQCGYLRSSFAVGKDRQKQPIRRRGRRESGKRCLCHVLRERRNGQAAFGITAGAGAQVRGKVTDVADGDHLERAIRPVSA
ncbi:hypothetical protein LSPH26S_03807 [Lysinibacillus sphaericus]